MGDLSLHNSITPTQAEANVPLLRIFLSSPGDVTDERNLACALIKDELPYLPAIRGQIAFEIVAWDDPVAQVPMLATETPQDSVNSARPRPASCDIVVVIIWSRIGTPLPESIRKANGEAYLSGTEWEFEDARTSPFKPTLLIYRRTEEPKVGLRDPKRREKEEQFEKVEKFFTQFRNPDGSLAGGVNEYKTPSDFKNLLRQQLEDIVWRRVKSIAISVTSNSLSTLKLWTDSPYPGLRPFQTNEAQIFFGRGKETDALIARLTVPDARFLAVVGDSGAGKSSLVYAGLLPRLEKGAIEGVGEWLFVDFKPAYLGDDPFLSLADSFTRRFPTVSWQRPIDLAQNLRENPQSIRYLISSVLSGRASNGILMLFIDQMEELFTQCSEAFLSTFARLIAEIVADSRCRVIVTLRLDFLTAMAQLEPLNALLEPGTFLLGPPGPVALIDMIRQPAVLAGIALDEELAKALLVDSGDNRGALPIVAFCLQQLYDLTGYLGRLTIDDYEQVGRLHGALRKHADSVVSDLERRYGTAIISELPFVFASLVSVDVSGLPTRLRASRDILPKIIVDALIEGRLLLATEAGGGATVEVAHEALFESWPTLAEWVDANRADLMILTEVTTDAMRWEHSGRDNGYLLRGGRLSWAAKLSDQYAERLTETVKAFLDESQKVARKQNAYEQRILLYERLRKVGLEKYVTPILEQRVQELKIINESEEQDRAERNELSHSTVSKDRASREEEINELENFLKTGGMWHSERAHVFEMIPATTDRLYIWEFSCCKKKVLSHREPSQFRKDGCNESPFAV